MRRYLGLMIWVVLFSAAVVAQTAADPITGTWTGALVLGEGDRRTAVTMKLAFDGKSAVTGTVSGLPRPANVKSGTFDAKTRGLTLRLGRVDGPDVLLVLEGTVTKNTANGTFTGDGSGTFHLTKD